MKRLGSIRLASGVAAAAMLSMSVVLAAGGRSAEASGADEPRQPSADLERRGVLAAAIWGGLGPEELANHGIAPAAVPAALEASLARAAAEGGFAAAAAARAEARAALDAAQARAQQQPGADSEALVWAAVHRVEAADAAEEVLRTKAAAAMAASLGVEFDPAAAARRREAIAASERALRRAARRGETPPPEHAQLLEALTNGTSGQSFTGGSDATALWSAMWSWVAGESDQN